MEANRKGDAQLETQLSRIEAPPERERPFANASKMTLPIGCQFSAALSREPAKRRAPNPLHAGRPAGSDERSRRRTIQGRRVGRVAWKTSPASRGRRDMKAFAVASSFRVEAGRRGATIAPGSSNAVGRRALNAEIEVRCLVRDPSASSSGWPERLSYTQEAAGSNPASPTHRVAVAQPG